MEYQSVSGTDGKMREFFVDMNNEKKTPVHSIDMKSQNL